ncbi:MAG TPA: cobyrinate a,c-diamide synthase [Hyphomicrobium sp.]|nr:cobyrinate a,c-diamide synthase [Hyphomicrobium sp.]
MTASRPKGIIIAAPRSGAGKTTVTLGLLRALRRDGIAAQPYKCGPDYIDPAFHAAACGRNSFNLDTWAMRPALIENLITRTAADADIAIAEGVMGLFDGAAIAGQSGTGSTADLAAVTGWPVVLVLDIWAQAQTAAAVVLGCKAYRPDVVLAGVILNGVSSARHAETVEDAITALGVPVLGRLFKNADIALPERHLGLVQAAETADIHERLDGVAAAIRDAVSLDGVVAAAVPLKARGDNSPGAIHLAPPGQRIALACDAAFSFTYPHVLQGWRDAGAEIIPFSPLADEMPDAGCDAIWLPGGYPELHAASLARAESFRRGMHAAAARGTAIHGECGGYMALGSGLITADGDRCEMLGLLGLETSFAARRLHLGYRRALDETGHETFGHEFHYASVISNPDAPFADIRDIAGAAAGDQGARRANVTGTFFHLIDTGP